MTSILAHKVMQALLMLATSDICPDPDWYGEDLLTETTPVIEFKRCVVKSYHSEIEIVSCVKPHQAEVMCEVPLAPGMREKDARAFHRLARKLAGR